MNKEFKAFMGIVSGSPILFMIGLALSFLVYTQYPIPLTIKFSTTSILTAVGGCMILLGTIIAFSAQKISRKVSSPEHKATTESLMQGPYKYSRHPGTLSLFIMYVGFALVVNSLVMIIAAGLFFLLLSIAVLPLQEKVIAGLAPEAYAEYKKKVRMWI